jgi:para-aminobenzoate synthetase component 1
MWTLDGATRRAEIWADDDDAARRLLHRIEQSPPVLRPAPQPAPRWEISPPRYRARVARVLEYLHAGDVYQVNISHRLRAPMPLEAALPIYLRLRELAPAPLGVFVATDGGALLGNSPELFLSVRPGAIETRPIKGTRPRGVTPSDDALVAEALLASDKDRAEHVMIVDLERSDLGRIAEIGSVAASAAPRLYPLPTVHHLVSTVRARPRAGVGLAEILRATFPGGSITGAPKVRAMEIIDELEGGGRGAYCGAVGWLAGDGGTQLALSIRTAVVTEGELTLAVGGGIVADSTPDGELRETEAKAAAFLRALGH